MIEHVGVDVGVDEFASPRPLFYFARVLVRRFSKRT